MPTRTEVRSSHLRAFPLPGGTRVALVPEQAVLLAGDRVEIAVRVAAGEALEVVEPGGTVAYAMRGASATWDVAVEVADGGRLVWEGQPFVVAQGADVRRRLTVSLEGTAAVTLRETLVLGRTGEEPGRLRTLTEVERESVPVLVEALDSAVGLGRHRVLDQVLHLGVACPAHEGLTLSLESGDTMHRWLGGETHTSPLETCHSSASPEYATTPRLSALMTSRADSRSGLSPAASAT